MKKVFILSCLLLMTKIILAQVTVSGNVTSAEDGTTIPGVNVMVKGTTIGTITNLDGIYTLNNVPADATLVFSFVGMHSQEIDVSGQTEINVILKVDIVGIEEVVAIGYGTAKSKDLTAPISTISNQEIVKNVTTSAISSLQGSVSGVQVINQGAPGAAPELIIRGIGSMYGQSPLFVVDGMFYNDINWLSPNDIQTIAVLKDASAASIYGVRAAGGVIMVTTKQGNINEGVIIEYDGYAGINKASHLMKMCNTEQYSTMLIEQGSASRLDPSMALWGVSDKQITVDGTQYSIPAVNTDWYNELLSTGRVMNHSLSFRGGSQKTSYHVGTSYFEQEGLLKSDNNYKRVNLKASLNFNPYKFLRTGATIILNHNKEVNPGEVWEGMYEAVPIIPVHESNGDFAGVLQAGYITGPVNNPVAQLHYTQGNFNYGKSINIMYSAFADVKLLGNDKLVWRTQFSQQLTNGNNRYYTPQYFVDDKLKNDVSILSKGFDEYSSIHLDHTLTYTDQFGNHSLTALAGFSTRQVDSRYMNGIAHDVPGEKEEYMYFTNSIDPNPASYEVSDGGYSERGVSFFGRLMYNYDGKYLFNATFRGDGTDKYSQTWGYFPSFGVGWIISDESFMSSQKIFDYLKLRASWGQLGNNSVPRESGTREITTGFPQSYVFNGVIVPGYITSVFYNELEWEVLEEANAGVVLASLDNRLSAEIDWYRKVTKNAAIYTSNIMGGGGLVRNAGRILNTGIEINLGWRDKIGELGYNISANLSTLKNEVLDLGGEPYIDAGSAEFRRRSEVGQPIYSHYGYKVIGVYQNWEEIYNHIDTVAHPQVEPGFLKYEDVDGNKIIDENDREYLGANIPKVTYGGQINLDYKNFDFGVSVYGIAGNKIVNRLRGNRAWHADYNFDVEQFENRWTGEGTSNTYPSAKGLVNSWNLNPLNSFLVESGSYFRVQNITLGYTFKNLLPGSEKGSTIRIRLAAQNPLSFFKFNGFTPEVTGQGEAASVYPIPSSYIIGINITY
jgi:TonB-linked SusC/RagA family outer membrane protein